MRGLWTVFFGFALALGACAQEPAVQTGQFYGPIVSGAWAKNIVITPPAKTPTRIIGPAITTTPQTTSPALVIGPTAAQLCSIPLLKVQIPEGTHFTIQQINPRAEAVAAMPQAKPPAPSCDAPPSSVTK